MKEYFAVWKFGRIHIFEDKRDVFPGLKKGPFRAYLHIGTHPLPPRYRLMLERNANYSTSQIYAHSIILLFSRKAEVNSGKKKKYIYIFLQISNSVTISLNFFPIWCNVISKAARREDQTYDRISGGRASDWATATFNTVQMWFWFKFDLRFIFQHWHVTLCRLFILQWASTWQNKMACVSSKDSGQPGYPFSLIRVFAVHMKKPWVLSYPWRAQQRLKPGWSVSLLAAQLYCLLCHAVAQMSGQM